MDRSSHPPGHGRRCPDGRSTPVSGRSGDVWSQRGRPKALAVLRAWGGVTLRGDHPTSSLPKGVGDTGSLAIALWSFCGIVSVFPIEFWRLAREFRFGQAARVGGLISDGFGLRTWVAGKFRGELPCHVLMSTIEKAKRELTQRELTSKRDLGGRHLRTCSRYFSDLLGTSLGLYEDYLDMLASYG